MKRIFSCLTLSIFLASSALADEIVFKNGDRLVGAISTAAGGKITLESVSAGKVTIDMGNIKTMTTDAPITVVFKDGTSITQKLSASQEEGKFSIGQGVVQPQSYNIGDISKINPPPVKWTGSISAGATITRGNSTTQNANVDINAVRKSDDDRITFNAGYAGSRQKDPTTGTNSTTKRMEYGSLQYDYFFSKELYGYANTRAEKDAIALVDLRLTSGVGAGYQFIDVPDLSISGEAGVSWLSENFNGSTPSNDTLTSRLAYHLNTNLTPGVKLFSDAEWYESFEDFDDQNARGTLGLRSSLTKSMFAEAKVVWAWDSTPAIGKKRQDVSYILGIGWSF